YELDRPTSALSGGELQRLALAGVLAMQPGLLLLDEPTSMLDDETAARVRRSIVDAAEATGATTVLVEHRIGPWLEHVDRVLWLDSHGQLVDDTPPEEFVRERRADLAAAGVWMPGLPTPEPLDVPQTLTGPAGAPPGLRAESLTVDL